MATYKLSTLDIFPQGTSVGAYLEADFPTHLRPPSGAPAFSPVETQVMDSDGADFTALDPAPYFFGASVSGTWRWVRGTPTESGVEDEAIVATGLTGATAASRYVGATASGAPVAGTFAKGDYVIDQTGEVWICTVAGTPGTWKAAGSGTELAFAANTSGTNSTFTDPPADLTGVTITFTVGSKPVYVESYAPLMNNGTNGSSSLWTVTDEANVEKSRDLFTQPSGTGAKNRMTRERISTPGTYTRKVRCSNNGTSGTVTVFTQLAGGAWIRAVTA